MRAPDEFPERLEIGGRGCKFWEPPGAQKCLECSEHIIARDCAVYISRTLGNPHTTP